jgi:GNAT superfamily N-acetyltransferase
VPEFRQGDLGSARSRFNGSGARRPSAGSVPDCEPNWWKPLADWPEQIGAATRDNSKMDDTPKTSPPLTVEVALEVHAESREVIARGLREFNSHHLGNFEWTGLDVYVRDGDGQVVGGLIGDVALGWFSIHALWVVEGLRGSGLGTDILNAAEAAAIKRGCRAAILDTLSFQAPTFYEKRGYVQVGVVDDYRGGVQRIFMQKRLHV